jgi:hypothetical protein
MSHVQSLRTIALFTLGLALSQGCAEAPPERLLQQHDIAALTVLANHYTHQAENLRDEAKHWDSMAEYYEKHPELDRNGNVGKHAARCREVARHLRMAAEAAAAFAKEQDAIAGEGQGRGMGGQTR